MVLAELPKECLIRICQKIVVPDPRPYKYLLNTREGTEFSEQFQVIGVIHLQVPTGSWEEAKLVHTGARPELFAAGGVPEVGGRPPYIMDVPFKVR